MRDVLTRKTVHESIAFSRTVTFHHVLADDEQEAEALAQELCPIDDFPARASLDTRVYRTLNQDADLKKIAVNYPG